MYGNFSSTWFNQVQKGTYFRVTNNLVSKRNSLCHKSEVQTWRSPNRGCTEAHTSAVINLCLQFFIHLFWSFLIQFQPVKEISDIIFLLVFHRTFKQIKEGNSAFLWKWTRLAKPISASIRLFLKMEVIREKNEMCCEMLVFSDEFVF